MALVLSNDKTAMKCTVAYSTVRYTPRAAGSHDHALTGPLRAVAIGEASREHTLSQPMSFHCQDAGPVRPSVG